MQVITLHDMDERVERIKQAESFGEVFVKMWLELYGIDLKAPGEPGSIEPWNYQISNELTEELMSFGAEIGADTVGMAMIVINSFPSGCSVLERNQIAVK